MQVLKAYYLQLRAASAADPGLLPVTARQLESLVRNWLAAVHLHCLPNHATPLQGAMPEGAADAYVLCPFCLVPAAGAAERGAGACGASRGGGAPGCRGGCCCCSARASSRLRLCSVG